MLHNIGMSGSPLPTPGHSATFDLHAIAASLPATADTMLVDVRLTDEPAASSRVFRIYRDIPAHYHRTCDEYLQVLSGRARFTVGDAAPQDLGPGRGARRGFRRRHAAPRSERCDLCRSRLRDHRKLPPHPAHARMRGEDALPLWCYARYHCLDLKQGTCGILGICYLGHDHGVDEFGMSKTEPHRKEYSHA